MPLMLQHPSCQWCNLCGVHCSGKWEVPGCCSLLEVFLQLGAACFAHLGLDTGLFPFSQYCSQQGLKAIHNPMPASSLASPMED